MKSLVNPGCKQEILARIQNVRHDMPRRWGKMNAPQMVCHLNDAFLTVMGDRKADVIPNYRARGFVKWFALNMPMKWPQGVPTVPEIDAFIGGTAPAEFAGDVQTLVGLVERFTKLPRDFEFRPHPIFLEMTESQWMRWGYLHTDHHLRQFGL